MYRPNFLWLMALFALFFSCQKVTNVNGISVEEWQPDVAFPIFRTSVTTQELLNSLDENSNISQDSDGFLTFAYNNEVYTVDGSDLADLIPNANFPMPDTVFYLPYNLPNNIDIDFIVIKEGSIGVIAYPIDPLPGVFTLNIPELTFNNVVFNESVPIPAGPVPGTGVYPMPDYVLSPENDTMTFRYSAKRDVDGGDMLMQVVTINLQDMRYGYAQGYLGNSIFSIPRDSIKVDFLDFLNQGELVFEDPKITVNIRNSFGFPVRAKFLIIDAILEDGTRIPLNNADLDQGIDINFPSLSEAGAFSETSFTVDKNNSNIQNIIGQPIKYFDYEIEALTNPDYDSTSVGFLTDSSYLQLDLEVELPLHGTARDFTICDTFALDLSTFEELRYAEFKLYAENEFPVDVWMQMYFLDENGVTVDSLSNDVSSTVMDAGQIDANGKVLVPTIKETLFDINEDRFTALKERGKQVVLKTIFTTYNNATIPVKFYSDYDLKVNLGVIAGLEL